MCLHIDRLIGVDFRIDVLQIKTSLIVIENSYITHKPLKLEISITDDTHDLEVKMLKSLAITCRKYNDNYVYIYFLNLMAI